MQLKLNTKLLSFNKHEIDHKIIISHFIIIIQFNFPNHAQIYTDVSKSDQGIGFAIICNQTVIKHIYF